MEPSRAAAYCLSVLRLTLTVLAVAPLGVVYAQLNDDCNAPTVVAAIPFVDTVNTSSATSPPGDPPQALCGLGIAGNSVWYEFTAPRSGTYAVNSHGSDYETAISLYSGGCAAPVEIECGRAVPGTAQNALRVNLSANQTVLIKVTDGVGGGGGDLAVAVDRIMSLEAALTSSVQNPLGGAFSDLIHPHLPPSGRGRTMVFEGTTEGVFWHHPLGVLITIAVTGDVAPATGSGTFRTFGPPDVNDNGVIVFHATVDNGIASEGIFQWVGGALTAVVVSGQPSPMLLSYESFDRRPTLNNGDEVAFAAQVGSALSGTVQQGVFLASAGSVSTVASTADTDPCTGGSLNDLARRRVSISDVGNLVFTNGNNLYTATVAPGSLQSLVCEGDPAPGAPVGASFVSIGKNPTVHNAVDLGVVFQTRLDNPRLDAVYFYSPTLCASPPICPIAIENDTAPGGVGQFSRFFDDMVADISVSGGVAFQGVTQVANNGVRHIFRADPSLGTLDVEATAGSVCEIGGVGALIRPGRVVSVEANSGDVVYAAQCNLGRGVQREPLLGTASEVASRIDATTAGNGFEFLDPATSTSGGTVFRGVRRSVFSADCSSLPCTVAPTAVATPLDLIAGMSGSIDDILLGTVDGDGGAVSFVVRSGGVASPRGDAIVVSQNGALTKIVRDGDPVPGIPGATFLQFSTPLASPSSQIRPILRGQQMGFRGDYTDGLGMLLSGVFHVDLGTAAVTPIAVYLQPAPQGGGPFLSFSNPAASSRDVVFVGISQLAWCAYRYRAATGALDPILCEGDAIDAPVGGTVSGFTSAPSFERGKTVVVRVSVNGGTSSECYVQGRRRRGRALACVGTATPVGAVLDSFTFSAENYLNPLRRRRFAYYAEVDHFGVTSYTALTAGRIRRAQLASLRAAAELEPTPLGGRFAVFDDFTPLGMSIERRTLAFNADLVDAPVGSAIFFGDIR